MGDIFLILFGFLLTIISIVGAFIPVIPSPLIGWCGLFLLSYVKIVGKNPTIPHSILIIVFIISIIVTLLDYIIPALGAKKMGGSKYGTWGAIIGTLLGLVFPLGIVFGTFAGAFVGELINNSRDQKRAFKAAIGAVIGFLLSSALKCITSIVCFYYFVKFFILNLPLFKSL